jgi:pSer/pThr/pTyr-binding forkhead associated (FHA) protein
MRVRLVPLDDGPPIELVKDVTLIGRNEDCDVRFEPKSVSKIHCVLVKTDGLVLVRDLGSTNGTRVNGKRVRRGALLPNDHVAIATFRYVLKFGEALKEEDSLRADDTPPTRADVIAEEESSEDVPKAGGPPLRRNTLPDEYPDSKSNR